MRRVLLFIPLESARSIGYLHGVSRYARPTRPWEIFYVSDPRHLDSSIDWGPDGAIIRTSDPAVEERFALLGLPALNLSNNLPRPRLPVLGGDERAISTLAADEFRGRGFRNIAYCGMRDSPSCFARFTAFRDRVMQYAQAIHYYDMGATAATCLPSDAPPQRMSLEDWVRSLPTPTAMLAQNDNLGIVVCRACRNAGVSVPEQVAVLGVGDTAALCELAWPPLSSVATPGESAGFAAAKLLDQMMRGRTKANRSIVIRTPLRIVSRQSTDILAIEDPDVAAALIYIRQHATERVNVQDLLRAVPVSRRPLERSFRTLLGRTPLDELHRLRVQHARDMLSRGDFTIPEIALQCGFRDRDHLTLVFRRLTGQTPAHYRKLALVH